MQSDCCCCPWINNSDSCCARFVKAYYDAFSGKEEESTDTTLHSERRVQPEPWHSPPFPGHEYQGYPLIGTPPNYSNNQWPLMKALHGSWLGDYLESNRINVYGWVEASGNFSTAHNSNLPTSYWVVPNHIELDQTVVRVEREVDMAQTQHD